MNREPQSGLKAFELTAHILGVNVRTGFGVIHQIPARMIRIVVDDEIIAAIPAPGRSEVPVPRSDLEEEPAVQPEAVRVAVDADHVIAVGGAKMFETATLDGMSDAVTAIVRSIVTIPMVMVHVRRVIDFAVVAALLIAAEFLAAAVMLRSRGNSALIRVRSRVMRGTVLVLLALLRRPGVGADEERAA